MNPSVTSKETILKACRQVAMRESISALNMRSVARECGIALGTLYNYYADKDALILAAVEDIWAEILHSDSDTPTVLSFEAYTEQLFHRIRKGVGQYPGFLCAHSIVFAGAGKDSGRHAMERCFGQIRFGLLESLRNDPSVNPSVFTPSYTQEAFADFTLENLLMLLIKGETDCSFLIRTLGCVLRTAAHNE